MASASTKSSSLLPRIVVGVLLALFAIAVIWLGGWAFTALVAVGVILLFREWAAMMKAPLLDAKAGIFILLAVSVLTQLGLFAPAFAFLAVSAFVVGFLERSGDKAARRWSGWGLLYAGLPALSLIWLRGQPDGFALVMWTMGLVWATDILAYFSGRTFGGAKIWAAISPNKTWAGLLGGMLGAGLFAGLFGFHAGWAASPYLLGFAGAMLAVVAQAGDFFESWLKRRAGVKDSGTLLPGHGGIMDRVDGLVPVAVVVSVFFMLSYGS